MTLHPTLGVEVNGGSLNIKTKGLMVLIGLYAMFRTTLFHITNTGFNVLNWYSSIEFLCIGIYATLMIYSARTCFDEGTFNHKMVTYFGYGFILWAIGNFTLMVEAILFTEPSTPAFSDIFYISGYLPIIYIMILRSRSILVPPEKKRLIGVSLIFFIFCIVSITLAIIPILSSDRKLIVRILAITYLFLDIALMGSGLAIFPKYAGGKLEKVWFLVSLCIIGNAISDLIFTYEYWHNSYNVKSWGNDLIIFTYLLVIIFASYIKDLFRKT